MIASLVLADLCTVIRFRDLGVLVVPVLHGIGLTVAIGACLSLVFGGILSGRRHGNRVKDKRRVREGACGATSPGKLRLPTSPASRRGVLPVAL